MNRIINIDPIYFISGHRDITVANFYKHYVPMIDIALDNDYCSFVVGDCMGVDIMAQIYLASKGIHDVTVYHMLEHPRFSHPTYERKGGYISDVDRDLAMTLNSDIDIAWIDKGRERSGTGQNLERRTWVNERMKKGLSCTLQDIQSREANNFL